MLKLVQKLFFTIVILIFINSPLYSKEKTKLLLTDSNKKIRILIPASLECNPFIIKEINLHLQELTGEKPILLKKVEDNFSAVIINIKSKIPVDSYEIMVNKNKLYISGGNNRGLYYGIIAFFEYLGCRWYAPGKIGEVIPKLTEIEIPENLSIKGQPSIPWRGFHICGSGLTRQGVPKGHWDYETALWMIRNKMNFKPIHNSQYDNVNPLLQELLLSPLAFGHSYSKWIPSKEFTKHPEFFSMINGKRQKKGQFCVSNPELRKELVRRIVEYAEKHPDLPIISLAPNDGYRWCECPNCVKLDTPQDRKNKELNQRTHWFNAQIARELKKINPNITISSIAYCNYLEPGENLIKTDNLLVGICITKSQNHPLTDEKSPSNTIVRERFLRWQQKVGKVFWSAYYLSYGGTFPRPYEMQLAETIRFLKEHNLNGLKSEVVPGNYDKWRSAIYYMYLIPRLLYDSTSDPNKVLDDFCENFYGPAAESCKKYYLINRKAVAEYKKELIYISSSTLLELYPEESIRSLEQTILTAEQAVADNDIYSERVALLRKQFDEIKSSRLEMKKCAAESKSLTAEKISKEPKWSDFDNFKWINMRQRSNYLLFTPPSSFVVRAGEKKLWLFFKLGETDMSGLSRESVGENGFHGSNVDFFFSPEPESEIYYQLAVNYYGK